MKLLYLVVDTPDYALQGAPLVMKLQQDERRDEDLADRQSRGQQAMPTGSTFCSKAIPFGPGYYHESAVGLALCVPGILEAVRRWEAEYDAILVGCFVDPGVAAARTVASIPVVGPGQASFALAQTIGDKFGVITILPSNVPDIESLLSMLGLRHKCVGVRSIGRAAAQARRERFEALTLIEKEASELVRSGADSLILGCMGFGFAGLAKDLSEVMDMPVVDPLHAGISVAFALSSTGLRPSSRVYPPIEWRHELDAYLDWHRLE